MSQLKTAWTGTEIEEERHNGPATVAHRLNVVKNFYDYCEIDEGPCWHNS